MRIIALQANSTDVLKLLACQPRKRSHAARECEERFIESDPFFPKTGVLE
jgi:hypothetical protein